MAKASKTARSNRNQVQRYILQAFNGMNVDESQNLVLESILDKAKQIDTPEEAKRFMDSNASKIEQTAARLDGKQYTAFSKACEYVYYAIGKGMAFMKKHWLKIVGLIALILVAMYGGKMLSFLGDKIFGFFDPYGRNVDKFKASAADAIASQEVSPSMQIKMGNALADDIERAGLPAAANEFNANLQNGTTRQRYGSTGGNLTAIR